MWGSDKSNVLSNVSSKINVFYKDGVYLRILASLSQQALTSPTPAERLLTAGPGRVCFLMLNMQKITVGVTQFQNCLVIKPRPNAFTADMLKGEPELYEDIWDKSVQNKNFKKIMISRPGLMLCNPVENREEGDSKKIIESYYYVSHQGEVQSSQFLNLYDLVNRPLLLVLRGRKEFIKMYHLLKKAAEGGNSLNNSKSINNSHRKICLSITLSLLKRQWAWV